MSTSQSFGRLAASLFRNRYSIFQELAEVYKPSISQRGEKLLETLKEKVENASKSELAGKLRVAKGFYRVEMAPPSDAVDMKQLWSDLNLLKDFMKKNCFKQLTVKQAVILFFVALEVSLWFYLGETIGKFHIIGYSV